MTFKSEYVELVDFMGTDLSTVNSARVSFAKESDWYNPLDKLQPYLHESLKSTVDNEEEYTSKTYNTGYYLVDGKPILSDKDTKLINYLAKHGHFTPFTQNAITLRIKMPIFVERQWFKSSVGFSRNSESRRYISTEPEFWTPTEWRMAAKDKKQGSSDEVLPIDEVSACYDRTWGIWLDDLNALSLDYYNAAIEKGVAPELARMILPQSMFTTFIETGSLAAYARLVKLRTTPDAQLEIQQYANRVSEIMGELFPVSWKALMGE